MGVGGPASASACVCVVGVRVCVCGWSWCPESGCVRCGNAALRSTQTIRSRRRDPTTAEITSRERPQCYHNLTKAQGARHGHVCAYGVVHGGVRVGPVVTGPDTKHTSSRQPRAKGAAFFTISAPRIRSRSLALMKHRWCAAAVTAAGPVHPHRRTGSL